MGAMLDGCADEYRDRYRGDRHGQDGRDVRRARAAEERRGFQALAAQLSGLPNETRRVVRPLEVDGHVRVGRPLREEQGNDQQQV